MVGGFRTGQDQAIGIDVSHFHFITGGVIGALQGAREMQRSGAAWLKNRKLIRIHSHHEVTG